MISHEKINNAFTKIFNLANIYNPSAISKRKRNIACMVYPLATHRKQVSHDALHFVCLMVDLVDTPSLVGSLAYTGFHVV